MLKQGQNYNQMAITCRASTEHLEMPQVVLLLKMPCDSTSWTGTQVANHSWPIALAKSWTGSPETWRPHEPGAEGRPAHIMMRGAIYMYLPAQRHRWTARPTPRPNSPPHSTQKSEPLRENEEPAVRINSLEVHRGSPRPDQRSAYRENISL